MDVLVKNMAEVGDITPPENFHLLFTVKSVGTSFTERSKWAHQLKTLLVSTMLHDKAYLLECLILDLTHVLLFPSEKPGARLC